MLLRTPGGYGTVDQVIADAPVGASGDMGSILVDFGGAPGLVLGDMAVVIGAGVVGLASEREGEHAGHTLLASPLFIAGEASCNDMDSRYIINRTLFWSSLLR